MMMRKKILMSLTKIRLNSLMNCFRCWKSRHYRKILRYMICCCLSLSSLKNCSLKVWRKSVELSNPDFCR